MLLVVWYGASQEEPLSLLDLCPGWSIRDWPGQTGRWAIVGSMGGGTIPFGLCSLNMGSHIVGVHLAFEEDGNGRKGDSGFMY